MKKRVTAADPPVVDDPPSPTSASTPRRRALRYRFRVAIRRPATVLGLLGLVLFGYLIAVPIVS
ncbi:ABC transporter permease, partial [Mycobacterium sp. ITM-2017-0098]